MIVRLFGSSGLTKAYRSVLSAAGSPAMSGASRWLEARTPVTDDIAMSDAPARATSLERVDTTDPPMWLGWRGSLRIPPIRGGGGPVVATAPASSEGVC